MVAATLAAAAVTTAVGINQVGAGSNTASSFVPTTPCRLLDTRAESPVGDRRGALTTAETVTLAVTGAHGNCSIPTGATGFVGNVTIVRPTAAGYLQLFPADAAKPSDGSNLNWVAGQAPTPNQVTVALSDDGRVNMFNFDGNVEVVIDINGYYQAGGSSTTGAVAVGAKGDTGAAGAKGDTGPQGEKGDSGAPGPKGDKGDKGEPGTNASAGHWGLINRNVVGSATAELRSGPFTRSGSTIAGPPNGSNGSLNLSVATAADKVAWGNEVDFAGQPLLSAVTAASLDVYNTGENIGYGGGGVNMPSIAIELVPNMPAVPTATYTSLVWTPVAYSAANAWTH